MIDISNLYSGRVGYNIAFNNSPLVDMDISFRGQQPSTGWRAIKRATTGYLYPVPPGDNPAGNPGSSGDCNISGLSID